MTNEERALYEEAGRLEAAFTTGPGWTAENAKQHERWTTIVAQLTRPSQEQQVINEMRGIRRVSGFYHADRRILRAWAEEHDP